MITMRFLPTLATLCLIFAGCATAGRTSPGERWQCRNDLEVSCSDGACEASAEGEFTPMSVDVDGSGAISVCAYSGCWEGTGEVLQSGDFLVLLGTDLQFSTSPDSADVVIVIDRGDQVAALKVGEFALPLLCEPAPGS